MKSFILISLAALCVCAVQGGTIEDVNNDIDLCEKSFESNLNRKERTLLAFRKTNADRVKAQIKDAAEKIAAAGAGCAESLDEVDDVSDTLTENSKAINDYYNPERALIAAKSVEVHAGYRTQAVQWTNRKAACTDNTCSTNVQDEIDAFLVAPIDRSLYLSLDHLILQASSMSHNYLTELLHRLEVILNNLKNC